jgi:hypothetical protein
MKSRKLRISWSVFCGLVCVLLIALWARSLRTCDLLYMRHADGWKKSTFRSSHGTMSYEYAKDDVAGTPDGWHYIGIDGCGPPVQTFAFNFSPAWERIRIPNWLPLIFCTAAGIGPWLQFKRFALRTLLIAMTLIAVGLGIIAYATR